MTEFSRLPREAFYGIAKGIPNVLFVYLLPVVVVSNVPSRLFVHGFQWQHALWLLGMASLWLALAVFVFHRGLRRYSSASS